MSACSLIVKLGHLQSTKPAAELWIIIRDLVAKQNYYVNEAGCDVEIANS
jgi:hypothetical protein